MTQSARKINRCSVPESLQLLIDCVGKANAFRLVEWRGGAYICIPAKLDMDHPLLEVLGETAYARLVEWYAGETVMLPKNDVIRHLRHAVVKQLRYEQRMPIADIALETGYTMRQVFNILEKDKKPHDDEDQARPVNGDLFADLAPTSDPV